jgi:cysteine synthase A
MGKTYKGMMDLIGDTPLMELTNIEKKLELKGKILAKLECFNPTGSVKDRAAMGMIVEAEEKGLLTKGSVIIEPTSGNTGIGLAAIGAIKGYSVILTMPETMSVERRNILKAYGAQVVLTDGAKGMAGAIEKAKELASQMTDSFMPSQFDNMANPRFHYKTTGPEIWQDTDGKVDIFVSGVGTGGTITGVGEYLKAQNPKIKVVAVEPSGSPILSKGEKGPHGIQGIGAGFVPTVLNTDIYDEIITVKTDDAFDMAKELAKTEGILGGISSGAALWAAVELAKRPENVGKSIVLVLPDTGERYYSTPLFG